MRRQAMGADPMNKLNVARGPNLQPVDPIWTTIREEATEAVERDPDLHMHPLPLALPRIELMQIWHERTDADRLRRWFRQQVQRVADSLQR